MRIGVVGGGVVGLTCALRLAEAGHTVTVTSADRVGDTTSSVAGGLIYPPGTQPEDRCAGWMAAGVGEFTRLSEKDAGIRVLPGRLLHRATAPWPAWADTTPGFVREDDVPSPWTNALRFSTPVVDLARYLGWLSGAVAEAGVAVEYRRLASLAEVADADLVVNAAGLGGGALAGDGTVAPVGGQVVHLTDPGLTEWIVDEDAAVPTYVIPHGGHVVCGGTEERGRTGIRPDPEVAEDILRRCRALVPELDGADVLGTRVGLRPWRPEVRLDRDGDVIHCYGHGGAGVTLSWGCADEVVALAG
ncbi:FAD-dependent oxidoreductase [Amycolatopsis minnesotensis]|uniref:D-amino-acid oxidase n=1 Tax=Amycolatopsis minnesotensis TaxID=337894 RepID=A0ABP5BHB7_9PSEU